MKKCLTANKQPVKYSLLLMVLPNRDKEQLHKNVYIESSISLFRKAFLSI